jgi:hypothetical protein
MPDSPFKKLLLIILFAATGAALLLKFINLQYAPQAELPPPRFAKQESRNSYPQLRPKISTPFEKPADNETNILSLPRVPCDKAEAWLAKHNRNAASLLAVFRAMGDTNYLNEAATNFPNDPQVELAVLSRNAFPEDRRKWLDSFKASSPSNSLANYLSAQDLFKNGKTDEAVQELLAASEKSQFQNYSMETQLNGEELYQYSGKSPIEAVTYALSSMAGDDLPQLATFKGLAQSLGDLMKQKSDAGDADSTANLAQIGLTFADKINSGDSGKLLINQLVGMAVNRIILSQLNQDTGYDFLNGQTPAQIVQQLKDEKKSTVQLVKSFRDIFPSLTDEESFAYRERMKIYGETEAMKWVIQQHPPANPAK